jgi:CheY-like chemotaxis protein
LAESVLGLLGVEVVLAEDGLECLEALRRQRFDLIFMDYLMPRLNGLQTTAEIRRMEGELTCERTPIVALTASAFPDEIDKFFIAGADDALVKPYRIEELAAKVEQWAARRG